MRPVEQELLALLLQAPFLDRIDAAALCERSTSGVYRAMSALEAAGLVESVSHASEHVASTRRFAPTAAGVRRLAEVEGATVNGLLRARPVSAQWRRVLLERLDAAAVVYRLAAAVAEVRFPLVFRWFRAMPADAAIVLPDGRVIAVVRQGSMTDRTGFAKRVFRLARGATPSAVLLLASDETRLRHAKRLLAATGLTVLLATERDAVLAGPSGRVWRTPSGAHPIDLERALGLARGGGERPAEAAPVRASPPTPVRGALERDCMLPSLLGPVEKRAVGLLADWPWITPTHLGALMGLRRSRLSAVIGRVAEFGLAHDLSTEGRRRLAPTDRALAMLARRDRASVGAARRRWSAGPVRADAPLHWRSVTGRRSRQLLRNLDHTDAVHDFVASLARQARERSVEVVQLDPPRRASRYFLHDGRLHSVQPDAFFTIRREGPPAHFFLEWERRAIRPATMAARLAPYLRYYATGGPVDDHGGRPTLLVVFEDELAQTHFLRVARREMAQAGVRLPMWVSHRALIEREGPMGEAWTSMRDGGREPPPLHG